MKLWEIKKEALRLMLPDRWDIVDEESVRLCYNDESCKDYLAGMISAINRCFSSIEEKRVLPEKAVLIDGIKDTERSTGAFYRYNLDSLPDFFDIEQLAMESDNGEYVTNSDFRREGNMLVLPAFDENKKRYTLIYYPRLTRLAYNASDSTELSIPDNIAEQIPFFVKGELFRHDEPGEAAEARNCYEQSLDEIKNKKTAVQSSVVSVWSVGEI